MKKSVLIITYYNSKNYGAFMQAFAMQEFLKTNGIKVEILKYKSKTVPILTLAYKLLKKTQKLSAQIQDYQNQMGNMILNEQNKLNISNSHKKYDATILGSDEIWNVKNTGAPHDVFFFVKNKNSDKTISYAACAGNSEIQHFKLFPYAISGIKKLDSLSVRDDKTQDLVKLLGRKDVERVLDPTFLIDWEKYLPNLEKQEKYIFVYSYGLKDSQIYKITELAQIKNLKIVATGTNCPWADYNPIPSPFEWISYIKNAEFVCTSTFHGVILSVQLKKGFAVFNSESPKIYSILKELYLLERRVTEWNSLKTLFERTIDYVKLENYINQKIVISKNFILKNLDLAPIPENKNISLGNKSLKQLDRPCYVARHRSMEVRWNSRSGGAFTAISDVILEKGGVVYGAVINENFITQHQRGSIKEERDLMRGSKYVQSDMRNALLLIKKDLQENRQVLFTGTPCEVDAVKKLAEFLGKEEQLVTTDFICHGVPSPAIWKDYLKLYDHVTSIEFRDKKRFGWGDHQETIISNGKAVHSKVFTTLYYQNFINRPSCHECPYAKFEHYSDITIGDCWGVEKIAPRFNTDDSGVSMIFWNSARGELVLQEAMQEMEIIKRTIKEMDQPVMKSQGMGTTMPNVNRDNFWNDYKKRGIKFVIDKYSPVSAKQKIKQILYPPHIVRFTVKKIMRRN